jgi:hypothetical protein
MKIPFTRILISVALLAGSHRAAAQGTAFTYQGMLISGTDAAEGSFDLTFGLFSVVSGAGQVGNTITNSAVGVTNGLFTVTLDFGANFPGADRWLEIGARSNGVGAFTTLAPRQKLTPAPYAVTAGNVEPGGGLSGAYSGAVTFDNPGNSFAGNGGGLTNVNAATLGGLPGSFFWQLGGNAGTSPNGNFLGTTDNQALELRVNGMAALLLQPAAQNTVNVAVGPFCGIGLGLSGVTLAGGGNQSGPNLAYENWTTIGGGIDHQILSGSACSVIAGGESHRILTGSGEGAIGGGYLNTIGSGVQCGTIPGGASNLVSGSYSFAAGNAAQATNSGAFVWADNSGGPFASTSDNQFSVRALGGARFVTGGAGVTIDGEPVPTGPAWSLFGNSLPSAGYSLGTLNDQPLEIVVNGVRAGLITPFPSGSPSVQWGTYNGVALTGLGGNVIGGGGSSSGGPNLIYADFCVIGGGYGNMINPSSPECVIAGGQNNLIQGATAVIGGGANNTISNACTSATIPGGQNNLAAGDYAFAAGYKAEAINPGSFVWSDGTGVGASSTADNSVTFRASGGYTFFTDTDTSGVQLAPGGGAWTTLSDRNAKKNFEPVNTRAVLDTLAALPVCTWSYRSQDASVRHMGPTAQDFKAAFAVGESDTGITTVDADGVALAAIKGLNEKLEASVKAKDKEIQSLQLRLERLEKLISNSPSQR